MFKLYCSLLSVYYVTGVTSSTNSSLYNFILNSKLHYSLCQYALSIISCCINLLTLSINCGPLYYWLTISALISCPLFPWHPWSTSQSWQWTAVRWLLFACLHPSLHSVTVDFCNAWWLQLGEMDNPVKWTVSEMDNCSWVTGGSLVPAEMVIILIDQWLKTRHDMKAVLHSCTIHNQRFVKINNSNVSRALYYGKPTSIEDNNQGRSKDST